MTKRFDILEFFRFFLQVLALLTYVMFLHSHQIIIKTKRKSNKTSVDLRMYYDIATKLEKIAIFSGFSRLALNYFMKSHEYPEFSHMISFYNMKFHLFPKSKIDILISLLTLHRRCMTLIEWCHFLCVYWFQYHLGSPHVEIMKIVSLSLAVVLP